MSMKSKKRPESEFIDYSDDSEDIWPEWSDVALNREKWAIPKNGPDGLFQDVQTVSLPSSLEPSDWIRATSLKNLTEPLTLFSDGTDYPDLITNNKHLLHSEFVRWFISSIINLQYYGRDGLDISGENTSFTWNGRNQPWNGWMHVYSMNKAGKGVQHRPTTNPNGKYVVRLHYMGLWRRIVVDDMIPVDKEENPLLPRTSNKSELWPMLLFKALLKIGSTSWSRHREIVDFHPVSCLTGWVCLKLDIRRLSPQDKWNFLTKYAEHFEWTPERIETEDQGAFKTKTNSEAKTSKDKLGKPTIPCKPRPVTLFLGLKDTEGLDSEAVPDLPPFWSRSYFVYVAQSRNIPLDPKDVKPPLPRWKLYRWLKWAIDRGLIDPREYFVPIRFLKIIDPLKLSGEMKIETPGGKNEEEKKRVELQKASSDRTVKTERRGRKNKHRSRSREPEDLKPVEESRVDVGVWSDFNRMESYVNDVYFFYKLDYFQYSARMSDAFMPKEFDKKSETKKSSKKGSKKSSPSRGTSVKEPGFVDTHNWPRKISKTRNEPLYLFCDSLEEKFFLINFSTCQYSSPNSTTLSTRKEHYLVVERHSWFHRTVESDLLVSLSSSGTKSTVLELQAGRHLLRLFCSSETRCFVSVSSNTIFSLGDRWTMQRLMIAESERIDQIVKRVSNSVSTAYQSFGTMNYSEALKAYYRSYMPSVENLTEKDRILCKQLHQSFIEEEVGLIKKTFPTDEATNILRSLRIFFVDPSIGLERFDSIEVLLKSLRHITEFLKSQRESIDFDSTTNDLIDYNASAAKIQSFLKMVTVKKFKEIHDPKHIKHNLVLQNLHKLVEMFDYTKRESWAHELFRNILKRHDRFYDLYPCSKDFQNVLRVHGFKGTLSSIKSNQWLPILRLSVNSEESQTVFAAFDLFVALPRYSVRVLDNETGREILRVSNNVVPGHYRHAKSGYTIFAYGWSDDQTFKDLDWTFNVVTMRGEPVFHILETQEPLSSNTEVPSLIVEELSNIYIPNTRHYICKWIVTVIRRSLLSLKLKVSYDRVEICLRIVDSFGKVLHEVEGKSAMIVPAVCLRSEEETEEDESDDAEERNGNEGKEAGDSTERKVYYVEAFVLNDTWPLTETEWAVVADAKQKIMNSIVRTKSSSSRFSRSDSLRIKRPSKQSVDAHPKLEQPYWTLQVVTDLGSGVEICQDRTREKELARMKEIWAKENPGSLQRGKELREAFLNKYSQTPAPSESKSLSSGTRPRRDSNSIISGPLQSMQNIETRTLTPPQSHSVQLPPLDLSLYLVEDNRRLVTFDDEEKLLTERQPLSLDTRDNYDYFLDEMTSLLNRQKEKYINLLVKHKEAFWDRRSQLDEVYQSRKSYITKMKPVATPRTVKGSVKSKKT